MVNKVVNGIAAGWVLTKWMPYNSFCKLKPLTANMIYERALNFVYYGRSLSNTRDISAQRPLSALSTSPPLCRAVFLNQTRSYRRPPYKTKPKIVALFWINSMLSIPKVLLRTYVFDKTWIKHSVPTWLREHMSKYVSSATNSVPPVELAIKCIL